jgi:hypothetical protein
VTLKELIDLYRAQSLDGKNAVGGDGEDVFCSDELLAIYASEAQDEACRRGQLLRDAASPMCTVAYAAGDESVALDGRVVQVLRAFVDGWPADVISAEQMECFMPTWQASARAVRPTALVSGLSAGRLHLWPVPSQDGQLKLHVLRLPLKRLKLPTDRPEIRQELHPALVDWMLYRAYSRVDTDMYNDAKAAIALAKFEAEFGDKRGGRNEQWVRDGAGLMPGPIA